MPCGSSRLFLCKRIKQLNYVIAHNRHILQSLSAGLRPIPSRNLWHQMSVHNSHPSFYLAHADVFFASDQNSKPNTSKQKTCKHPPEASHNREPLMGRARFSTTLSCVPKRDGSCRHAIVRKTIFNGALTLDNPMKSKLASTTIAH